MLSNSSIQLHFDDFLSKPIHLHNGTTQDCPLSMILYGYYNANLIHNANPIDMAQGIQELSTCFVDHCAFIATANTLDEAQAILKNMMERNNETLDWSLHYTSPFKLSNLAVMDIPRTPQDVAASPLLIDKTNANGTITKIKT